MGASSWVVAVICIRTVSKSKRTGNKVHSCHRSLSSTQPVDRFLTSTRSLAQGRFETGKDCAIRTDRVDQGKSSISRSLTTSWVRQNYVSCSCQRVGVFPFPNPSLSPIESAPQISIIELHFEEQGKCMPACQRLKISVSTRTIFIVDRVATILWNMQQAEIRGSSDW